MNELNTRTAQTASIPRLDWKAFERQFIWRQGEHVSLIGPTGSGKTTLAYLLLEKRRHVVVYATKPRDLSLSVYARLHQYDIIRRWPPGHGDEKVVLWPGYVERYKGFREPNLSDQYKAFTEASLAIFSEGSWAIYIDEVYYLTDMLNQETMLKLLWTQGRSLNISIVAATQRPKEVPLVMYDQATHLFFWRFNDENDVKRIGGIGSLNSKVIQSTVLNLPRHHFLYVNAVTGDMCTSIAPKYTGGE